MTEFKDLIRLREWTKEDFDIVRNILLVTWKDTYGFIPIEDLELHLEKYYSKEKLFELYNNSSIKGILANLDNKSVAWMKLFDDISNNKFYVSSLYVLPGYQGIGIGKILIMYAEKVAQQLKHDKIWLGVMKKNKKTLDWYIKLGFNFIKQEPFLMGKTEVIHYIGCKTLHRFK